MYLHLGDEFIIPFETIIGIFDLDNASYSKHTRKFLQDAEENGSVISVSDELPKAFILTQEYGIDHVYLTQFSAATLEKRFSSDGEKAV